jgi:hypothetical protein
VSNEYTRLRKGDVQIARVVGETEEGLTLFVPKDLDGVFHLEGGEAFLSIMFVRNDGHGGIAVWVPWEK